MERINPNMTEQLREAMKLQPYQLSILQNMAKYAGKYCPNKHILELLYDYNQNMACEMEIYSALRKQGVKHYSWYVQRISKPFQKLLETHWNQIINVITNMRSYGDTPYTGSILTQKKKLSKQKPNQIMSPSKNQPESIPVVAPSDIPMKPSIGDQQDQSAQNQVDQIPKKKKSRLSLSRILPIRKLH